MYTTVVILSCYDDDQELMAWKFDADFEHKSI